MFRLIKLCVPIIVLLTLATAVPSARAEFALKTITVRVPAGTETRYQIDTDAGLVFTVRASGPTGTRTAFVNGDITNLVYQDIDYQSQTVGSHVVSGADRLYAGMGDVSVAASMLSATGIARDLSANENGLLKGG